MPICFCWLNWLYYIFYLFFCSINVCALTKNNLLKSSVKQKRWKQIGCSILRVGVHSSRPFITINLSSCVLKLIECPFGSRNSCLIESVCLIDRVVLFQLVHAHKGRHVVHGQLLSAPCTKNYRGVRFFSTICYLHQPPANFLESQP